MVKTARIMPRLFPRSEVPLGMQPRLEPIDSTPQHNVPVISTGLNLQQRKRKSGRKLSDMKTVVDWERTFTQRKKTLMQKAMELEEATGAVVTVTVRTPAGEVFYYGRDQVACKLIKKSGLLGETTHHVTAAQLKSDRVNEVIPTLPVQSRPTPINKQTTTVCKVTIPMQAPQQKSNGKDLRAKQRIRTPVRIPQMPVPKINLVKPVQSKSVIPPHPIRMPSASDSSDLSDSSDTSSSNSSDSAGSKFPPTSGLQKNTITSMKKIEAAAQKRKQKEMECITKIKEHPLLSSSGLQFKNATLSPTSNGFNNRSSLSVDANLKISPTSLSKDATSTNKTFPSRGMSKNTSRGGESSKETLRVNESLANNLLVQPKVNSFSSTDSFQLLSIKKEPGVTEMNSSNFVSTSPKKDNTRCTTFQVPKQASNNLLLKSVKLESVEHSPSTIHRKSTSLFGASDSDSDSDSSTNTLILNKKKGNTIKRMLSLENTKNPSQVNISDTFTVSAADEATARLPAVKRCRSTSVTAASRNYEQRAMHSDVGQRQLSVRKRSISFEVRMKEIVRKRLEHALSDSNLAKDQRLASHVLKMEKQGRALDLLNLLNQNATFNDLNKDIDASEYRDACEKKKLLLGALKESTYLTAYQTTQGLKLKRLHTAVNRVSTFVTAVKSDKRRYSSYTGEDNTTRRSSGACSDVNAAVSSSSLSKQPCNRRDSFPHVKKTGMVNASTENHKWFAHNYRKPDNSLCQSKEVTSSSKSSTSADQLVKYECNWHELSMSWPPENFNEATSSDVAPLTSSSGRSFVHDQGVAKEQSIPFKTSSANPQSLPNCGGQKTLQSCKKSLHSNSNKTSLKDSRLAGTKAHWNDVAANNNVTKSKLSAPLKRKFTSTRTKKQPLMKRKR